MHNEIKQIEIMTTQNIQSNYELQMEAFNKLNPLQTKTEKDGFILEIRERGYFIFFSNGRLHKQGIRLHKDLKAYFGV